MKICTHSKITKKMFSFSFSLIPVRHLSQKLKRSPSLETFRMKVKKAIKSTWKERKWSVMWPRGRWQTECTCSSLPWEHRLFSLDLLRVGQGRKSKTVFLEMFPITLLRRAKPSGRSLHSTDTFDQHGRDSDVQETGEKSIWDLKYLARISEPLVYFMCWVFIQNHNSFEQTDHVFYLWVSIWGKSLRG